MAARTRFHRGGLLAISAAVLLVTFASGYALGHGTQHPSTTASGCSWTSFPTYPNATAGFRANGGGVAYRTYVSASRVARFYESGGGQSVWTFVPAQQSEQQWVFRFTTGSGCHGVLVVSADGSGATLVEANPDPNS